MTPSIQAVRDGVIEAVINHEEGYMQSKEKVDVYMTGEPLAQYHQRVRFCLDIRNQSVKAMRYPPKSYSKDLETAEVRLFSYLLFIPNSRIILYRFSSCVFHFTTAIFWVYLINVSYVCFQAQFDIAFFL